MTSRHDANGVLLAASCGTVVKAWDPVGASSSSYTKPMFFTDTHTVASVDWSPDQSTLAYGGDSRIVHLKNWKDRSTADLSCERQTSLRRLSFGFDGSSLVGGGSDGSITLWNCRTAHVMTVIKESASAITALATARAETANSWHLAFANASADLSIYHVENHVTSRLGKMSDPGFCVKTCLAFSSHNTGSQLLLASGDEKGYTGVCDAVTRYSLYSKRTHKGSVLDVCFGDRMDLLMTCGIDGNICGLDLRSAKVDFVSCSTPVMCLALHPNGKIVAFGTQNGELHLRDRRKMAETLVATHVHPESAQVPVSSVKWQPSTKTPASRNDARKAESTWQHKLSQSSEASGTPPQTKDRMAAQDVPFSPLRTGSSMAAAKTPMSTKWKKPDDPRTTHITSETPDNTHRKAPPSMKKTPRSESIMHSASRNTIKGTEMTASAHPTAMTGTNEHEVDKGHQTDSQASNGDPTIQHNLERLQSHVRFDSQCTPEEKDPQTTTLRQKASLKNQKSSTAKAFLTPQPKCNAALEGSMQMSVPVVKRKRPRKSGSFSEFVESRCSTPERESMKDDSKHGNVKELEKETVAYWRNQYMKLREDMFEMHFQLMKEIRVQNIAFTKRQDDLQRQHQETWEQLKELKKLVEKRLNDSISFI